MTDTQADPLTQAGKALARARWGNSVLRSAIATLAERRGELNEPLKAQLREIAGDPARDGDNAA
jgi:hypothetical protein